MFIIFLHVIANWRSYPLNGYLHTYVNYVCVCVCFVINASFLLTVISIMPVAVPYPDPISVALFNLDCPRCQSRFIYHSIQLRLRLRRHFFLTPPLWLYAYLLLRPLPISIKKTHENSINFTVTPVKHCTVAACSVGSPDAVLGSSVCLCDNSSVSKLIKIFLPPRFGSSVSLLTFRTWGHVLCLSHSPLMRVDSNLPPPLQCRVAVAVRRLILLFKSHLGGDSTSQGGTHQISCSLFAEVFAQKEVLIEKRKVHWLRERKKM